MASLQSIRSELGSYNVAKCWTSQSSLNLICHYTSTYLVSLDIGCPNKNNTVLLFLRQLHSMPIWSVRQTADVWYYLEIVFSFLNNNWTRKNLPRKTTFQKTIPISDYSCVQQMMYQMDFPNKLDYESFLFLSAVVFSRIRFKALKILILFSQNL